MKEKRIGILTSGGDCQSLNAVLRAFGKTIYNLNEKVKIFGFLKGYHGLMYNHYVELKLEDFSGLLSRGGTILGTSRQPFSKMRKPDEDGNDKVELMKNNYKKLDLDCLVVLGGNGSLKSANMLSEEGLNVIALPKTIDNDIYGTDQTFGYQSAIDVATNSIDLIHTTAASHNRIFLVEIMGHKVGWLALESGIAGGADVILLPEVPYDINLVYKEIKKKDYAIIVVAEGALSQADAKLNKKEYKKKLKERKYPSIAYQVAAELEDMTDKEIRVAIPGHMQRGGRPSALDRLISSRIGAYGAMLVTEENYGQLVVIRNNDMTHIPMSESAGVTKFVPRYDNRITEARMMGIGFGAEFEHK